MQLAKSNLNPSQTIQHLGMLINTRNMTLKVPSNRIRDLEREALSIFRKGQATIRGLASFIGKAQAMSVAILLRRLNLRKIQELKIKSLESLRDWSETVQLKDHATQNLTWWKEQLSRWYGNCLFPEIPEIELYTDASDTDSGIFAGSQVFLCHSQSA
ncbi:hypothetical protein AYI70_g2320 [Smittium culicis]|uniref:Reverse transcriptase/retrotransposon-derived protein RNase H-like domain-containing protein n=1 Tax=Smittium culicis TaxID=133412 RepID=A0A1R1Y8R8_9FUNG|nr:hypothetical protein AYI70_g2320 [Smittium culicis]